MAGSKGDYKLIKADRLIDGTGNPTLKQAAILINGDTIEAIGPSDIVVAPESVEAEVVNYGDKTILPGLVDCHVHLIGIADGRLGDDLAPIPDEILTIQAAHNAEKHLRTGVTTVRDCGAKNMTTFMLRKAVVMGLAHAPRLILSGRPISIVGGHMGYFGTEVTGINSCRAAVRQLIKEGADFIKVTATGGSTRTSDPLKPSFKPDELKAICEESHNTGKHVAAHCASTQGMLNAIEAGVDTIIHAYHREADGTQKYRPDVIEKIVRNQIYVNPTLHQTMGPMKELEERAMTRNLTKEEQQRLDKFKHENDTTLEHVSKMIRDGVRMVCGSDSAWRSYAMGNFQKEVEEHVKAGASPINSIVSATRDSARSCWVDNEVGTLETGKKADILIVEEDPSKNISALSKVAAVFLKGSSVLANKPNPTYPKT